MTTEMTDAITKMKYAVSEINEIWDYWMKHMTYDYQKEIYNDFGAYTSGRIRS